MKTFLCLLLLVPAAHCFQKEEREEIRRTLRFQEQKEPRRILIDNTHGSIVVTGYAADSVQLFAMRRTRAESDDKFREAMEDVKLELKEQRNRIEIIVEAPWRNKRGGMNYYGYRYYGYDVEFDFEVKVPKNVEIFLRTVNDGDIEVRNFDGPFEVKNVNGSVEMIDIAGSGRASTVNGSLRAVFRDNPTDDCAFQTVNGKVEVTFQEPLSAELELKTFNGNAYTEFDAIPLPRPPMVAQERKGKKVYRRENWYSVRVGEGGPRLSFDTLNGNIHILKHQ